MSRTPGPARSDRTPVVVAADIARFGSDETIIAVRKGKRVRIAETYGGRDTMTTTGRILRVARELHAATKTRPTIVVDDVGVGGGVSDRLREVAEFRTIAFNAGASPRAPLDYPNRRSEVWFALAERLPEIDLDRDEQLAADLVGPRYTIDSRGRRVVEPKADTKKRLGRSPDRADAVLMAFAVEGEPASASVEWDGPSLIFEHPGSLGSRYEQPPRYDSIL
jgi:phage terminase large subunit